MEKFLKLGIIGMKRGLDVGESVKDDENICIRAICDQNQELLEKGKKTFAGNRHGLDLLIFSSFDELLASDVDAVFLANFAPEHTAFAIRALNAGKHVLSEVPAIFKYEEARALREAVSAHPELTYMIAENACYWAFIEAWKIMHEEGKFGEIVYAESEYLHAVDPKKITPQRYPDSYWRTHIPAIQYLTHNLGPLLYIMGDKCTSVTCLETDVKYNPYKKGSQCGAALFKTEKGAVIRILVNFGSYVGYEHNFRLQGTKGSIETANTVSMDKKHSFARFSDIPGGIDQEKMEIPVGLQFAGEDNSQGHGGADRKTVRDFADCVLNGKKPRFDIDFAMKISVPGIAAHESAQNGGQATEIPEI